MPKALSRFQELPGPALQVVTGLPDVRQVVNHRARSAFLPAPQETGPNAFAGGPGDVKLLVDRTSYTLSYAHTAR